MLIVLALYYLSARGVQALPIRTIEQRAPSSCNDINNCRTLIDIIWGCLVTAFACTWVAVHPNIPNSDEKWIASATRRVGLTGMAIIAPELVIMWAIRQWVNARDLANKYRSYEWTVTHGFFAIMGGFVLFEDNKEPRTLDPWSLEIYLESGQIDITQEEVQDKSRGDLLSKGLVIVQTGWFILQCIARRVENLPITKLELETLAYATLSFITYGLWWNKPLGVDRPYPVGRKRKPPSQTNEREQCKFIVTSTATIAGTVLALTRKAPNIARIAFREAVNHMRENGVLRTTMEVSEVGFRSGILSMASADQYDVMPADRVPTFHSEPLGAEVVGALAIIAGSLIALIFGGIHCTAWSVEFPSHTERLLWRISSLIITSLPVVLLVVVMLYGFVKFVVPVRVLRWVSRWVPAWVPNQVIVPFAVAFGSQIPTLYILARLVLLSLGFTTLRALSPGAYQTIKWTTFIPHV